MEPMTLETPSNSGPSSPATTPVSPYLPSFLLGEPTSPLPGSSTSPKLKRVALSDSQMSANPRFMLNQSSQNHIANHSDHILPGEKVSGPPIRGLFDSISSPTPVGQSNKSISEVNSYVSSVSRQFLDIKSPTTSTEAADSTWVTVFGFPPAAASFILSQMASCGHILSKRVPASGNWMHVQFGSRLEAKKALTCNGKVYAGSVMIGVVTCRDESILAEQNEERAHLESFSSRPSTPRGPGLYPDFPRSPDASVYESPYSSPRIQARPLATRQEAEIYGGSNTPQKSSGIVSKAMEYILGW